MNWRRWTILALITLSAGWMLFDGTRALIAGDYITPSAGEYAGQLGPWSYLVQAIGIDPRSTLMKSVFAIQGFVTLTVATCFVLRYPWARRALIATSVLGLWFLPFGTVANLIVLTLLLTERR